MRLRGLETPRGWAAHFRVLSNGFGDEIAVKALMLPERGTAAYGAPLADRWDEDWEFVIDDNKDEWIEHRRRRSLGDCSTPSSCLRGTRAGEYS